MIVPSKVVLRRAPTPPHRGVRPTPASNPPEDDELGAGVDETFAFEQPPAHPAPEVGVSEVNEGVQLVIPGVAQPLTEIEPPSEDAYEFAHLPEASRAEILAGRAAIEAAKASASHEHALGRKMVAHHVARAARPPVRMPEVESESMAPNPNFPNRHDRRF